jgi:hypothetical protein
MRQAGAMEIASVGFEPRSITIDYSTMAASATNYVFQADMTYYISSGVNLYGTNTWEGGTVLKFASNACISLIPVPDPPQIRFLTSAYKPVVFTAKDDNTVAESISGSSGNPSGYYANPALIIPMSTHSVSYVRFAYAQKAISLFWGATLTASNVQILNSRVGCSLLGSTVLFQNALFSKNATNFALENNTRLSAENATFSSSGYMASDPSYAASLNFTNCIFANVTNLYDNSQITMNGDFNGFYKAQEFGANCVTNTFYPFQTVGGGAFYLTNGCLYRDVGTTNISPALLADLAKKTTYPPIVYSNASIYSTTNLGPQAQRDYDVPDLGYHYDPLDYAFGGSHVYTNLTFAPGTAVGWFRTTSGWTYAGQGIHIGDYDILTFNGTAQAPCYWVRANVVQEGGTRMWDGGVGPGGITGWANQNAGNALASPEVHFLFTRLSMFPGDCSHCRDDHGYLTVRATHSEVWSGSIGCYVLSCYMTNCLMDRASIGANEGHPGNELHFRNCTWHGGSLNLIPSQTALPVSVTNCAFDATSISVNLGKLVNPGFDYNAFTNGATKFPVGGAHDVLVPSFDWQSSWLGNFYLPANSGLVDHGSTNADLLGLYHFTTQTNQVKETNSYVDIGYHYVAADGSGNPNDIDGDGIPDYLEDTNGNGLIDPGESDPNEYYNILKTGHGLEVFTPLRP